MQHVVFNCRKEKETMRERKITAEVKARRITILLEIFLCICFLFISYTEKENNNQLLANCLLMLLSGFLMIAIGEGGYRLLLRTYRIEERCDESKALVESTLSTAIYTAIIPIAALDYERFILKELTRKAQFYAILSEDKDKVNIFIKFNDEETFILFEELDKDYFTYYYKVAERKE